MPITPNIVERTTLSTGRTRVGQERFARFGEVEVLVADDGLHDGAAREIEAAGEPDMVSKLVGLGVTGSSMSAPSIPRAKVVSKL